MIIFIIIINNYDNDNNLCLLGTARLLRKVLDTYIVTVKKREEDTE